MGDGSSIAGAVVDVDLGTLVVPVLCADSCEGALVPLQPARARTTRPTTAILRT